MRKIRIALALILALFLVCLASCGLGGGTTDAGNGGGGNYPEVYVLTFRYEIQGTGRAAQIDYFCDLGDVITAPDVEGTWRLGNVYVKSGEEVRVSRDMFIEGANSTYHSAGAYSIDSNRADYERNNMWDSDSSYDGNVLEYYANAERIPDEFTVYDVTLHSFDHTYIFEVLSAEYDVYGQVLSSLFEAADITVFEKPDSLDNVYYNGYVFQGFYTDPDYTEAYTENSVNVTDVYAKWEESPFVFEYSEWSQKYVLKAINITEDVEALEIPAECNFAPVSTVSIDWSIGEGNIGKLILPETLDAVNQVFFENCDRVREVLIPMGVDIGYRAFEYSDVTVTLAEGNTKYVLADGVIYDVESGTVVSLTAALSDSITVPNGITDIDIAFSGADIISVTLPESITKIKDGAFRNCTALTTVIAKGQLEGIEERAFGGCSAIDTLLFSSIYGMSIGEDAFEGCGEIGTIYYAGREDYWNSIEKDSSGLEGKVYFYSKYEQTVNEYLSSGEIRWYYGEDGSPTFWINVKNELAGKTFIVDYAEVTTTEWYWNMLVNLKNQNLLHQIADEELSNIVMNSETKADFDTALGEVNSRAEATLIFGENGTVTIYNDQNPEGYTYTYIEINDRVIITDPTASHVLRGEFFVDEDGTLYEIQPMEKIGSNETGEIVCYYVSVE